MKIIHTADWHIGKMLGGFSLLNDQEYFLDGLLALMGEERPDALIIAGDVYDRPVPSGEAVGVLNRFLSKAILDLKVPVLMTAGNHDSRERLSFGSELLSSAGLHIAGRLSAFPRKVTLIDQLGPVHFYLLPFVDPAAANSLFPDPASKTYQEAFDKAASPIVNVADFSERNVLICHGTFCRVKQDGVSAAEESVGGADLVDLRQYRDFDYIAAGHIHRKQNIASNMRYSGSILKYSPNEHNLSPSVTLVELGQKGELSIGERKIPILHDLKILKGQFDRLMAREEPDSDYVFAVLEDKELILNAAARMREKYPNLMGLSYDRKNEERVGTLTARENREKSLPELFRDFYEHVNSEEISAKLLAAIENITGETAPTEKGGVK